ncbi:MAG TPA: trypsin-like peptidase domain-containing protein [Candidatus Binatia bacterium]|jgi:hypothetical protein|nr:trypsin-like peptidase domain-containing protein [Candidatus Binatia bacterium]
MRNTVILLAALAIGGTGCDRLRNERTPAPIETPPPQLDAAQIGAVVRVDMGGKFRGAGVAVDPRYVITALGNLDEWEFHRRLATLGAERVPAKIVAVDKARGLALIKADRPLPRHATLAHDAPADRAPAVIVAFADLESEPPIVELRMLPASIDRAHYSAETTGDMVLEDAMQVSSPQAGDIRRRGAAVFDPATGRLAGMTVGAMLERSHSSSPFIAVSAKTLRAFLKANGVPSP